MAGGLFSVDVLVRGYRASAAAAAARGGGGGDGEGGGVKAAPSCPSSVVVDVALEVDGAFHFASNVANHPLGTTVARHALLRAAARGWLGRGGRRRAGGGSSTSSEEDEEEEDGDDEDEDDDDFSSASWRRPGRRTSRRQPRSRRAGPPLVLVPVPWFEWAAVSSPAEAAAAASGGGGGGGRGGGSGSGSGNRSSSSSVAARRAAYLRRLVQTACARQLAGLGHRQAEKEQEEEQGAAAVVVAVATVSKPPAVLPGAAMADRHDANDGWGPLPDEDDLDDERTTTLAFADSEEED